MDTFIVEPEVSALGVPAAACLIEGMSVKDTSSELESARVAELVELFPLLGQTNPSEFPRLQPSLEGYRELHKRVGASNRKNVAAPESLLRVFKRNGNLPRINSVVDAYNFVSLARGFALGLHDTANVHGDVRLKIATGAENFVPLGKQEAKPIEPGHYVYCDDADDVLCHLEVLQGDKSKVSTGTTACLLICQGNPLTEPAAVDQALEIAANAIAEASDGRIVRRWPSGS